MIETLLFIVLISFTNLLLKKINFLSNNTGQLHQTYIQKKYVPLSGGLFILLFLYYEHQFFDTHFIIYLSAFFILGFLTDIDLIKNPSYRFLFQIFLLTFFLLHLEIEISDIRIDWFNNLLSNYYFNIFFVLFCFLVLINGTNFVDGNNGISLGYFLIIFIIIASLISKELLTYDKSFFDSFILILIILLLFNLFNQLYIGDSGVYLLSLFSGYILIDIFNQNQNISPYFIVNIFWYPAFEILFSFMRKIKSKFSPLMPDTLHLHQLLFFFLSKKNYFDKSFLNSLTGLSINLFNLVILFSASNFLNDTEIQIAFLFMSIITYVSSYFFLLKFKKFNIRNKK